LERASFLYLSENATFDRTLIFVDYIFGNRFDNKFTRFSLGVQFGNPIGELIFYNLYGSHITLGGTPAYAGKFSHLLCINASPVGYS